MIRQWISGLLKFRLGLIMGAVFGVALSVALLAVLGVFISQSIGTMTSRAISTVSPDWQIQLAEGADPTELQTALGQVVTNPMTDQVSYADVTGFRSETGSVQQTGRGKVVGITSQYFSEFPTQFRLLAGNLKGNIIAQQTAANLHVAVGDTINVQTILGEQIPVTIDGIVEMPKADQFFQVVSATTQTAITAPPDNVLLIPIAQWDTIFQKQLERMPQTAFRQIHASFDLKNLSNSPADAANEVTILANNLMAKASGTATIGNNLEAKLNGVREDGLFAKVLSCF